MEVVHAAGSMPCSRALRPRLKRSTGGSNALLISCDAAQVTPDKVTANVLKSRFKQRCRRRRFVLNRAG